MKYVEKLKVLLPFFIFSNGVVSLSTAALCYGICIQNRVQNPVGYTTFIFFSTFLTYNGQRYLKANKKHLTETNHMRWVKENDKLLKVILFISFIGTIISFLSLYNGSIISLILLAISGAISLFYIQNIGSFNLRSIPQLKIHLIALIWVIATAYFPLFNDNLISQNTLLFGAIHYLYILGITIPFDIRDLKYDEPKYKTIPQQLGFQKAKLLSILLMVTYTLLAFYLKPNLQTNFYFIGAMVYKIILLILVNKKRNDFYYSGWLEASIIVVGLSMVM